MGFNNFCSRKQFVAIVAGNFDLFSLNSTDVTHFREALMQWTRIVVLNIFGKFGGVRTDMHCIALLLSGFGMAAILHFSKRCERAAVTSLIILKNIEKKKRLMVRYTFELFKH